MSKDDVKAVLNRVLSWPKDRQEDAVEALKSMEAQDQSGYQLTDEQVAEVKRRQAEKNPQTLTLKQFDKRLRRLSV